MADFNASIDRILDIERYYSNHPADKGGLTIWGISSRIFPREVKQMSKMSPDAAKKVAVKIYREKYWNKMSLDKVADQDIADRIFNIGVNSGSNTAVRMLQESLNEQGAKLSRDGILGPKTLSQLNASKEPLRVISALKLKQLKNYKRIIENDPTQKVFERGWKNRATEDSPELESMMQKYQSQKAGPSGTGQEPDLNSMMQKYRGESND